MFCRRASSVSSPNCGTPKPTELPCRILSFEAPVRPAAVVEVNREATADEITPKLDRE